MFKNITFIHIEKEKNTIVLLKRFLLILTFLVGISLVFFSKWFMEFIGKITPEQFMFNLYSPVSGTSTNMIGEILSYPVLYSLICTIIFALVINFNYEVTIKNNKFKIINQRIYSKVCTIIAIFMIIFGIIYGANKVNLWSIYNSYVKSSKYIDENYVKPNKSNIKFPDKKRNLIHIYLESIENSYFSKEFGGYMNVNLMPNMTKLASEGVNFSQNNKFGGPYQVYGTSWSVASMVNMECGIPLKIPKIGESYGLSGEFLPGITNLGDILESEGYNQTIMFGADSDYGGLTSYYKNHGNYYIFDYKEAKKRNLISKDYYVWWGFEDDKLYEYAKEEILRLYKSNKPFNFTMETADTHFPDGYLSKNAPLKYESKYANVISYSESETALFIEWIKKQPFYENTTIVLTGDHLSMDKEFFENFDDKYNRSTFNVILNSPISTLNNKYRKFTNFDMFPTILSSLNVKIKDDKLGLGVNLFSNVKTLVERDGLEYFNEQLSFKSEYYNQEFFKKK